MGLLTKDGEVCMGIHTDAFDVLIHTGVYEYMMGTNKTRRYPAASAEIMWTIEKPPFDVLFEFLMTAASVYNRYKSEVTGWVVYDKSTQMVYMKYPLQVVSGGSSSEMKYDENLTSDETLLVVLHSHHTMKLSFSGVDTHDELITTMFPTLNVVVKSIDNFSLINPNKNIDCRCCYMGAFYSVEWTELFEEPIIPTAVWKNVQRQVVVELPQTKMHAVRNISESVAPHFMFHSVGDE